MNAKDYEQLQNEFSNLLKKEKYMGRNKQEIYEEGIRACKSKLHEIYLREIKEESGFEQSM